MASSHLRAGRRTASCPSDFATARYDALGKRAAYIFSLFGSCSSRHQAQLMTSAAILKSTRPSFPLAVMLSPLCWSNESFRGVLESESIEPLCVPRIYNVTCRGPRQRGDYFDEHWTKLNVQNLTALRVAMYLDSDLVVLRNIDHVVRKLLRDSRFKEARTPQGCLDDLAGRNWFNTGVWGVKPDQNAFEVFLRWLRHGGANCYDGDQSAAMDYGRLGGKGGRTLQDSLFLHVGYNMKADQGPVRCLKKQNLSVSELYVMHFSGPQKPYAPTPKKDHLWMRAQQQFGRVFDTWSGKLGVPHRDR